VTGPTLTGLDLVRDHLAEARRYTEAKPGVAIGLIDRAIADLTLCDVRFVGDVRRVVENLIVGSGCMAAAPAVTDGYITGSLWELGDLASRLRKAAEAEGREAELMDGYGAKIEGNP
jgi:hypothetical protein